MQGDAQGKSEKMSEKVEGQPRTGNRRNHNQGNNKNSNQPGQNGEKQKKEIVYVPIKKEDKVPNNTQSDTTAKIEQVQIPIQQVKQAQDAVISEKQTCQAADVKKDNKSQSVCKLFKAGKCFYGDRCKFLHGKVKIPKDNLCRVFLEMGKCKYDAKCHFVHMSKQEWEEKFRHNKPVDKLVPADKENSDGEQEEEKNDFEYKSKTLQKKEKQKRLADEHKEHKQHIQKLEQHIQKLEPHGFKLVASNIPQNTAGKGVQIEQFDLDAYEYDGKFQNSSQTQVEKPLEVPIEKPGFDMKMIEAMLSNDKKEVENSRKFKPWIDVSKTEDGKLVAELNNRVIFNNDYVAHVKSLKDVYSRDIAQVQRNYMSSFSWVQKNHVCEIKLTPTSKKECLPLNFDISEGYFILRIALDPKGAGTNTQYQVRNTSIPNEISENLEEILNNIHHAQQKSVFRTLKYFDCNLEKIFKTAYELIEKQKQVEIQAKEEEEQKRLQAEEKQRLKDLNENEDDQDAEDDDEEEEDEEKYDHVEDPYFDHNDEDSEEEVEAVEVVGEEEEKKDPTLDLDLNMHCSLKDLQLRKVQVQCKSCKYITELTLCNLMEGCGDNVLVNNLVCVACNRIAAIYCNRPFICGGDLNVAFRIGSFTWHILDIQRISYEMTCEGCGNTKIVENYISGSTHSSDCHACFSNMTFLYFGFNIEKKVDQDYLKRVKKNQALKSNPTTGISLRPKKVGTFKQGEPLPKNGICSHYRHSYRYFRFPCCGKAFPCDTCHAQSEKGHDIILAKTMLCGYCSREQSIKQECSSCKKMLVRIASNSGYWEGGKGTRNQLAMSKADNHKYAGTQKTVSRRKKAKENLQKK